MNAIILKGAALRFHKVAPEPKQLPTPGLGQWFPTCGTSTLGDTRRTGWWYSKIIPLMAENTKKKGVKIKTQKQSYKILVYKDRLM
jgi:hypothetical protein